MFYLSTGLWKTFLGPRLLITPIVIVEINLPLLPKNGVPLIFHFIRRGRSLGPPVSSQRQKGEERCEPQPDGQGHKEG